MARVYKGSTKVIDATEANDTAVVSDVGTAVPSPWERNAQWLPIAMPGSSEHKFVGLVAVTNDDSNYLALTVAGSAGYTVDWGDGSSPENKTTGTAAYKIYAFSSISAATEVTVDNLTYRQVIVTVTPQGAGTLTSINLHTKHNATGLVSGYTSKWLDIAVNGPNLTSLVFGVNFQSTTLTSCRMLERARVGTTGALTSCSAMFGNCTRLQKVEFNGTNFNNCTNFQFMFDRCYALQEVPLFYTGGGTTGYQYMFYQCHSLRTIPKFDFSAVGASFTSMFAECRLLVSVPDIDFSNAVHIGGMFSYCTSLQRVPQINAVRTNTAAQLFLGCVNLREVPLLDIPLSTSLRATFQSCRNLRYVNVTNTGNVTDLDGTFLQCSALEEIPAMDTSKVTTMINTFRECLTIETIPWLDTSKVLYFTSCFNTCTNLKRIPALNTAAATTVNAMFSNCYTLPAMHALSSTTNVTDFSGMFYLCRCLRSVQNLDTANGTLFVSMFDGCESLPAVGPMDLNKATNISYMFSACLSLLEAPSMSIPLVTNMRQAFQACLSLRSVNIVVSPTAVTDVTNAFSGCNNLHTIPPINLASVPSTGGLSSIFGSSVTSGVGRRIRAYGSRYGITLYGMTGRSQLVEFFSNLGTAAGAQTINVTNTPGATDLTTADKLIATSKGYTLVPA